MEAYWGSAGIYLHAFFDLGTRWMWVVSFTPWPLYLHGKSPGTQWIGGWVGPRAVLDAVVKSKIPSPCQKSNPRTLIVQAIAQHYTNWSIMAPFYTAHVNKKRFINLMFTSLEFHAGSHYTHKLGTVYEFKEKKNVRYNSNLHLPCNNGTWNNENKLTIPKWRHSYEKPLF